MSPTFRRLKANAALTAATAYALYTFWLIGRMFWFLSYSMTSALHVDSLVLMDELHLFHDGKYGIGYLWAPYWGHRMLVPRLLLMADERFFHLSNTPLAISSLIAQSLTVVLLIWTEWKMLRGQPRWLVLFVVAATVHLGLSALQLESFLFGVAVLFTLGFLLAFAAIALAAMAIGNRTAPPWIPAAACACGLICVLCGATGVFIGPVVFLVAYGLRGRARLLAALALASVAVAAVYSVGYSNPGRGMSPVGVLLNPIAAIRITAFVLGGPITDQSLGWGAACGFAGILILVSACVRLLQRRASREEAALTGICVFLALHAFAFALGRFTPESVPTDGTAKMLGSHDFTVSLLFWSAALAVVISERRGAFSKSMCLIAAAIVGYLTLHTVPSQLFMSMLWLEYHRTLDAAGAGMIIGASDSKYLFELYPDQRILDYYRAYMQKNRLSVFADDRASWLGRDLSQVFGTPIGGCGGRIDTRIPAGTSAFRIEGYVTGPGVRFPRESQIIVTDATGRIEGLGNTLVMDEPRGGQYFVAYVMGASTAAYVITRDGRACRFAE